MWQPILNRGTFKRMVQIAASRWAPGPKGLRDHMLTGLPRCSRCGHKLHAAPVGDRFSSRCTKRTGTTACGGIGISSAPVDEAVEAMLIDRLTSPAVADAIEATSQERTEEADLLTEISCCEGKLIEAADLFADRAINAADLVANWSEVTIEAKHTVLATI